MPELPEVETTRRGIERHLRGRRISAALVHDRRLRWPVTPRLDALLRGQRVLRVERRAKYLLLRLTRGCLIIHLGMSGSLRVSGSGLRTINKLGVDAVVADLRSRGVSV